MSTEIMIEIDHARRLAVSQWENDQGQRFVTVAPQCRDRDGRWKLSHSGLILSPRAACDLAPALVATAVRIDGAPVDPMPTEQDREESRMP